jgi:hypothetical protein
MFQIGERRLIVPVIGGLLILLVPAARASDISFVDTFGNVAYEQTGNGNTLTLNGAFFSADLNSTFGGAYTSASFTYPGTGSPQSLTEASPSSTDYHFQTPSFATLADMEAAYPFGTYTFTGNNGDSAYLSYTADDYPQSNPYLTGTDYTSLQGMDSSQGFTFDFSPFTTGSTATDSFIFFTIFDETTGTTVFNDGFLPATTPSVFLPGGTLTPGDLYDYELDYSNRDILNCADGVNCGAVFPPQLGFDARTDGLFTTASASAVPEPRSYAVLLAAAFAGILILRRRRNATA